MKHAPMTFRVRAGRRSCWGSCSDRNCGLRSPDYQAAENKTRDEE
jgi:hypothetical protein